MSIGKMHRTVVFIASLFFCMFLTDLQAAVKLPPVLSDHMVLQCDKPIPIWGLADAHEKVSVKLGSDEQSTTADAAGKWMVKLKPLAVGGPHVITIVGSSNTDKPVLIADVLVGEVWLCSGQSNMQFRMTQTSDAATEIPAANKPQMRLLLVPQIIAFEPQFDCKARWVVCTPESVSTFPAAGYFFGSELHRELKVPVGLIGSSIGGTPAQSWTSLQALQSVPELNTEYALPYLDTVKNMSAILEKHQNELMPAWEQAMAQWKEEYGKPLAEAVKKWEAEVAQAKAEGKPEPRRPKPLKNAPNRPLTPLENPYAPVVLYNGMIASLIPFPIRGAIWYQGESNIPKAMEYRTLLPTMITDWRNRFEVGDFPFGIVQLANNGPPCLVADSKQNWPVLREAQSMTAAKLPNVGLAVAIDLADANNPSDIHPKNKHDVGRRLSLWALAKVYGRNIEFSGPIYRDMKIEQNKITLSFTHVGSGLIAKEIPTAKPGEIKGFEIAGADQKFIFADAVIEGDKVIVSAAGIAEPKAVRYGWADNPVCNLYNKENLPTSPFRTDDWFITPPDVRKP